MIRVSIVVATRNRSRELLPTLESVLAQPIPRLELLVVDDASSDDTVEVATGLRDPRIRLLRLSSRQGTARARNAGVAEARGQSLLFLDHDDRLHPGALPSLVRALESAPVEMAVVSGGFRLVRLADRRTLARVRPPRRLSGRRLLAANRLGCCATLVRSEAFRKAGGFDPDQLYEDWDLWLRLACQHPLGSVRLEVAEHGIHPGQQTASHERAIRARQRFMEKHRALLEACPGAAARQWLHLGLLHLVVPSHEAARSCLIRARQLNPWDPGVLTGLALLRIPPERAAALLRHRCLSLGRAGIYW